MAEKKRRNPEDIIEEIIALFVEVEELFEQLLAEQVASISDLTASGLMLIDTYTPTIELREAVLEALDASGVKIAELSDTIIEQTYESPAFRAYYAVNGRDPQVEAAVRSEAEKVVQDLETRLENLSGTTAISRQYIEAVNAAVRSMQRGEKSYDEVARDIIAEFGGNGIKVQYASGANRRLDSAIRMNVLSAYRQLTYAAAAKIGEEVGCDAVEISAHPMSAPDHEPVQGRVFLNEEFAKMQSGLSSTDVDGKRHSGFPRQIMQWNCRHFVSPFSTKWSERRYTDKQLADWAAQNKRGVELAGKHYTLYQVTQLQRGIETQVRRLKGKAVMAQRTGDYKARVSYQRKINERLVQYRTVSELAGVKPDYKRMDVQGYRQIRV